MPKVVGVLLREGDDADAFAAGGGGGGATMGTATIDFGSTPADSATVTVTAASVASSSYVQAFAMVDSTAGNDADQHRIAAASLRLSCLPNAGAFNIEADALFGLATGQFKVRYSYQ